MEFSFEWEGEIYKQSQGKDLIEYLTTETRVLGQVGSKIRSQGPDVPTHT